MDSKRGSMLSPREVVVLLLVALPLLVTASAIEAAHWVDGLPSLKALVFVPLVMWAYLARGSVPWWIGHPLAFVIGLVVAFILGAFTLSDPGGTSGLAGRLGDWFGSIGGAGSGIGSTITGVGLIAITLWMGHAAVWLAYRRTFALLSALPGLGVLLVALTFLPTDYYWYFFMYLLAAGPGIAYRHKGRWSVRGHRVPLVGTIAAGLVLMGITLIPVWRAPAPEGIVIPLAAKAEKPMYSFTDRWSSLFYGVPDRKESPFFSPRHDLPFARDPIGTEDDVLFVVQSSEPHRWRMRVYESYTGTGWVSHEAPVEEAASTDVPLGDYVEEMRAREEAGISVRMLSKASTMVSVGEPLYSSIPSDVELSPQPRFRMYNAQRAQVSYLPAEVKEYRDNLIAASLVSDGNELDDIAKLESLARLPEGGAAQPGGSSLKDLGFRPAQEARQANADEPAQDPPYTMIERTASASSPRPPVALLGQRLLIPHRQYSTSGSISVASPAALRRAPQEYPAWITDRYLQLPPDFPETVKTLAREVTQDATNPYDTAEALRRYLISLPYSLENVPAPEGQDWVEHFLFVQRRGFSQNYASSMITMLRSLGIPARLVVGFAPGVWDEGRGEWIVQAQHYHAWAEVYFPGYGWVEFEPTPADVQPALEYLGFSRQGVLVGLPEDLDPCSIIGLLMVGCEEPGSAGRQIESSFTELPVPGGGAGTVVDSGGGLGSLWALVGLGLALGVAVPVGAASYIRLGTSRLGYPTVTYASMSLLGRLAGVGRRPQDTPWEYSARLGQAFPKHEKAINRITKGFVSTRYGPSKRVAEDEVGSVRSSWRAVRGTLLGRVLLRMLPRRSW